MSTTHRELRIARAVHDLAHRPAGFDPLELLQDLTAQAVALLPVRCAGVTALDDGQAAYLTASDEICRRLEQDQLDLEEGPCLDSARTRQALPLTVLAGPAAARWPRFTPRAHAAGITAAAAVILRLLQLPLGALNLLMAAPPYASPRDLWPAQVLADATGTALAHRQELADKQVVVDQLQTALDSRLVIEQAKGVLAARLHLSMDDAFARLRAHARSRRQKLTDLAAQIARGDVPAELSPAR